MVQWLESFLTMHQEWVGIAIFLIAFLECLAVVGLLVPGVTLLFIASLIAGKVGLSLGVSLLLCGVAGWLADMVSYTIGIKYKHRIYRMALFEKYPHWLEKSEHYFASYGGLSLLIGRFVSPVRPLVPMMAGVFGLRFTKCLLVSLLASIAWSIMCVVPAWSAGAAMNLPLANHFWLELGFVLFYLLLLVAIGVYFYRSQKAHTLLYMAIACGFSFAVLCLIYPYLKDLDNGVLLLSKMFRSSRLDAVIVFITELGDYKQQFVVSAVLCFILLFMRQLKALVFFASTMLSTAVICWIIKETMDRLRPEQMIDKMVTFSFPSGHAAASFAFFLSLGMLLGLGKPLKVRMRWFFIASLPAIVIGLSRIYLGVHWLTDVIASALLSTSLCMLCLLLVKRYFGGNIPAIPNRCWKILLPVGIVVIIVSAMISFPHAYKLYVG